MSFNCLWYYHKPLGKKDLLTKSFSNPPSKTLFKDYMSPTPILDFLYNKMVEYLVNLTKLYAEREKEGQLFNIDQFEMRLFLGILMQSDSNVLPRKKMYWKNSTNVKSKSISKAMSRNRLEKIMKILLCCDNNNLTQTSSKMFKVRCLYNLINQRCQRFLSDLSFIFVDEPMLPYYRRHSSDREL